MRPKTSEKLFILLVGISVLVADLWHVITQWIANPPDRYFTGIAHYYADYFLYVSQIAQGVRGNWIWSKSMYTNEILPDTWVYWPNVLIGRLGGIFTTSPFMIYGISLAVFVAILLLIIYEIARNVFPKRPTAQLIAFLFCATASNFADIPSLISRGTFRQLNEMWFSPTPALNRLGGVPHQTLQTILLLGVVLIFSTLISDSMRSLNHDRKNKWFRSVFIILCFLAATISPIQMVLVSFAIVVTTYVNVYRDRIRHVLPQIIPISLGLAVAALGAYLVNRAFDTSSLYAIAKLWEASQTVDITILSFLLAMGPIILLIPFGVRSFLKSLTPLRLVLLLYGAASLGIVFTPIPKLMGTSPTRWIHPASYVIFPLLAAEGIINIATILSRAISRIMNHTYGITKQHIFSFALLVCTILYSVFTIPAIIAQVNARSTREASPVLFSDLNHIPKNAVAALTTLKKLPGDGVVLTDPSLPYDILVPIMSGKTSFTGHPVHTLYPDVKETLRQKFFDGAMTDDDMKQFFADHRIRYILTDRTLTNPMISPAYQNSDILIYRVAP